MNCMSSNRPGRDRENAATPPKVTGCHGGKDAGVSMRERVENKPDGTDN
jgi:hypothetical protein